MGIKMEVGGLVERLVNLVKEGSDGNWSPSHPTDAQRESIRFLCGAFLFILVFWQVTSLRTQPVADRMMQGKGKSPTGIQPKE